MNKDHRWHGWATPQQVREMLVEMYGWLCEHQEEGELRLQYEGPGDDWTFKPPKNWYQEMLKGVDNERNT